MQGGRCHTACGMRHCQSDECHRTAHCRGDGGEPSYEEEEEGAVQAHVDADTAGIVVSENQGVERPCCEGERKGRQDNSREP